MPKLTKILTIIVLLQTSSILALIYTIVRIRSYTRSVLQNNLTNKLSEEIEESSTATLEKTSLTKNISAHLVWWDQDKGVETIEQYGKYMYSISPFWYELTIDGEIKPFSGAEDEDVISMLKVNKIKIIPVISNEFKVEPLASIITDPSRKAQQINDIISIAEDYDGISLNYENLNASDKDNYTAFVTELAQELHKNDKTLSVHLHAKTEEPGTWNGPQAQDWKALGKVCDKLKIMAYDYHWSTSEAGAIAPPDWVENVIKHALTLIPKEKIYLGVPLYGYNWIDENGEGVTFAQASTLASLHSTTIQFDNSSKSSYFTYSDTQGNLHEVWFENAESVSYKLQLAKQYDLAGVDFWRLGDEDKDVWQKVEDIFKSD